MAFWDRVRFTARRLVVHRIGRRGGPSAIALSSSRTALRNRNPTLFFAGIERQTPRYSSCSGGGSALLAARSGRDVAGVLQGFNREIEPG
jgi:hypothetical protein